MPVREITWGLPVALSAMETVPLMLPATVGANVTSILQVAPTARAVPQVLVSEKLALATIDEIFKAAVPEFVTVTGRGELLVPTSCGPKLNAAMESEAVGDDEETLGWLPTDAPPQP